MSETKEPRAIEAIKQEFAELCMKAGQAQYQSEVLSREIKNLNERILQVNIEANKREQLDKAAKEASNG